jgi:dihydrofolate reductase
VIQQFLEAGLLDELQIRLIPIVLGSGTPLFEQIRPDIDLRIDRVVASQTVTHIRYRTR